MNNLKDTIDLMCSDNYKDRLRAEIYQTKIRYDKLADMLRKWGTRDFQPRCPRALLRAQLKVMEAYFAILQERAAIEDIELCWGDDE